MIESIEIRNFKAFAHLSLAVRPLTILTGVNNAGKSTVIQGLLLADLAVQNTFVPLNGPNGLAMGEASEVLHSDATEPVITLAVARDHEIWRASLTVPDDRSVLLRRAEMTQTPTRSFVHTYLSAERLGPRDLLEVSTDQEDSLTVGHRGEFAAHVLAQHERKQVLADLRFPSSDDQEAITVGRQTELWMQALVGPIQIQSTWLPSTNAAMLRFRKPEAGTEWLRPANIGFGVTYALPIVVAALTARPGSLLIVENPEAHLHPAGQSALGRFLGRVAAAGLQVMVETHSDHVINGIRRAVGDDSVLDPDELVIHYFDGGGTARTITTSANATLSDWPEGFFDQAERDLAVLARIRRLR